MSTLSDDEPPLMPQSLSEELLEDKRQKFTELYQQKAEEFILEEEIEKRFPPNYMAEDILAGTRLANHNDITYYFVPDNTVPEVTEEHDVAPPQGHYYQVEYTSEPQAVLMQTDGEFHTVQSYRITEITEQEAMQAVLEYAAHAPVTKFEGMVLVDEVQLITDAMLAEPQQALLELQAHPLPVPEEKEVIEGVTFRSSPLPKGTEDKWIFNLDEEMDARIGDMKEAWAELDRVLQQPEERQLTSEQIMKLYEAPDAELPPDITHEAALSEFSRLPPPEQGLER